MAFERGKSGNPRGRPPDPDPIPGVRYETRETLKHLVDEIGMLTREQITERFNNPNTDIRMLSVIRLWERSAKGDSKAFECLMNRSIGRTKEQTDDEDTSSTVGEYKPLSSVDPQAL
jgi:hypothetical protein